MKSMVTRPNTMTGGGTSVGTSSSGDGGGSTEEKDKISAKALGSKSGPKGDNVAGEKTIEAKKKGKLQRLDVGPPRKMNEKNGHEKINNQHGLEDVPLPDVDIPLPPQKQDDNKDGKQNSKEGAAVNNDKDDESKSGVVSFSFKKIGTKLGNTAFNTAQEEDDKQETESDVKIEKPKKILSAFTKVKNKDGTMELDWPSEMIQHTITQPMITFSCNPLMFDFTALFSKQSVMSERLKILTEEDKKEEMNDKSVNSIDTEAVEISKSTEVNDSQDKIVNDVASSNSKSKTKKKKKRKRKKHHKEIKADKTEDSEKKKKKKKHKHNHDKDDKEENKENKESSSKKRTYRKRTADTIAESGNESDGKKAIKHKKRKKSKKSKKKKKQPEDKIENKKSSEKTPKKSKAKKSSNVLEHLIDEVDGTDIKIKKENSTDDKNPVKKLNMKPTTETEIKQIAKITVNETKVTPSAINSVKVETKESGSLSSRKRQTSESSHSEATPSTSKKQKLTPRLSKESEKSATAKQEDTWSKLEHIYEPKMEENPKSKWDTSDSDSENKMDATTKQKKLTKKVTDTTVKKEKTSPTAKTVVKTETSSEVKKKSKSKKYDSRERSWTRSRSRSRRSRRSSYSNSSSRSRSRSYSTSSYDSRSRSSSYSRSRSRSRRYRSSSYSSYSSGYSRSRSRSSRSYYSRSRSRYSSYSRSRSRSSRYSTSRSRSRSYSRSPSRHSKRSYSHSSHSSHASQGSSKVMNRKQRRKKTLKQKQTEMKNIDPTSIPLPDLGTDDKSTTESSETKIEEKPENPDPMSIPLPHIPTKDVKVEKAENVSLITAPPPPPPGEQTVQNIPPPVMQNFMAPPPPPGMMGPNHHHGMYPGMPYDPRMRMPLPHYPNMPPPNFSGHYHGHPPYSQDVAKSRSPPPLPPPRSPSPQRPPPPTEEEEKKEVEAMSMDIPADQAERFQKLQKQAQKHAMRSLKRQMRQLKGENPSDSSSSSEEEEEKPASLQGEELEEDIQLMPIMSPSLSMGQPTYILAQPNQTSSPLTHQIVVGSDGRQFIIPAVSANNFAGVPIQAGAPMFAMPGAHHSAQPSMLTLTPGAGATPAHLTGAVQSPFLTGGIPLGASSILPGHHPLFHSQLAHSQLAHSQLAHSQLSGLHQLMPSSMSSAFGGHGPIVVGNQILIPRLIRPTL
ncbi:unnamed protein product [Mytilus coruscus]|uniref:Uncharacterized protein n=1 Tax=Mytilus coruscus TaxID=42192 RepID=A0A6J8A9Y9_MYTCO|nr:unnamed protein product [Mytilus coruscus]